MNQYLPWLAGIVSVAVIFWHNYTIYPWMLDPVRSMLYIGAVPALAVIARPGGAVVAILLFGLAIYFAIKSKRFLGRSMMTLSATIHIPFFLWRRDYYDQLLPNINYAKIGRQNIFAVYLILVGGNVSFYLRKDFTPWCDQA